MVRFSQLSVFLITGMYAVSCSQSANRRPITETTAPAVESSAAEKPVKMDSYNSLAGEMKEAFHLYIAEGGNDKNVKAAANNVSTISAEDLEKILSDKDLMDALQMDTALVATNHKDKKLTQGMTIGGGVLLGAGVIAGSSTLMQYKKDLNTSKAILDSAPAEKIALEKAEMELATRMQKTVATYSNEWNVYQRINNDGVINLPTDLTADEKLVLTKYKIENTPNQNSAEFLKRIEETKIASQAMEQKAYDDQLAKITKNDAAQKSIMARKKLLIGGAVLGGVAAAIGVGLLVSSQLKKSSDSGNTLTLTGGSAKSPEQKLIIRLADIEMRLLAL